MTSSRTDRVGEKSYHFHTVILAMGSAARYLGVPGEQRLIGRGVSTCATCDGSFFREHDIAVVGGGDSAMEEAMFLTRFARSVTIIHHRQTFRASKIMLERARTNPKIHFETEVEVAEVLGDRTVSGLRLRDVHRGTTRDLAVTAAFVAIGHDPRNELVKGVVDLTPTGYVEVSHPGTHTSVDGVFAVGDLVDDHYRQAVTAAGTGCRAAIDVERWLG